MTAAPRTHELVTVLDPVAALCRGGLPYHDAPLALPDEQPDPGLRVRREVTAPGLRLRVAHHLDDRVLADEPLEVTALPLDRAAAGPRRRRHPAATTLLTLRSAADAGVTRIEHDPDDPATLRVPRGGPGPRDIEVVLAAALRHRAVVITEPLAGDPVLLAGLLLALSAAGVPCAAPPATLAALRWLHPALRGAIAAAADLAGDDAAGDDLAGDDLALAATTAAQKRAAWIHHDLELRWSPGSGGPDTATDWVPTLRRRPWPAVGIVLTSRRPALLPDALAMIAAQQDVDLEVVVALHGAGDHARVEGELARHGLSGSVLTVPASVPFGAAIQAAVDRSCAPLVLKWDDDDLYGPHHVVDLVLAQQQTGAGLVGKAPEFVHLDATATTVWRLAAGAEAPSLGLAGGTFLTPRAALADIGGYPPVARAVDHHVKTRMQAAGAGVFRTHGFGFVLRRHGRGHTWEVDDDHYLRRAVRHLDGLPSVLELGAAADRLAAAAALGPPDAVPG